MQAFCSPRPECRAIDRLRNYLMEFLFPLGVRLWEFSLMTPKWACNTLSRTCAKKRGGSIPYSKRGRHFRYGPQIRPRPEEIIMGRPLPSRAISARRPAKRSPMAPRRRPIWHGASMFRRARFRGWRREGFCCVNFIRAWSGHPGVSSGGQRIKPFCRGKISARVGSHLAFVDHVHEFDALQGRSGRAKRLKTEHGPHHSLDCSVVLFDDVIQVFDLPNLDLLTSFLLERLDGCGIGAALVDCKSFPAGRVAAPLS